MFFFALLNNKRNRSTLHSTGPPPARRRQLIATSFGLVVACTLLLLWYTIGPGDVDPLPSPTTRRLSRAGLPECYMFNITMLLPPGEVFTPESCQGGSCLGVLSDQKNGHQLPAPWAPLPSDATPSKVSSSRTCPGGKVSGHVAFWTLKLWVPPPTTSPFGKLEGGGAGGGGVRGEVVGEGRIDGKLTGDESHANNKLYMSCV